MAPRKDKPQDTSITIPEDLTGLNDADLATLHDTAVDAFRAMLPEDGSAPNDEVLAALSALADGIEAVKSEVGTRDAAALARSNTAKELANKVLTLGDDTPVDTEKPEGEEGEGEGEDEQPVEELATKPNPRSLAARRARAAAARTQTTPPVAKRAAININLAELSAGRPAPKEEDTTVAKEKKLVALAAQGAAGFDVGRELTIGDMAASINSRLGGFNGSAYDTARRKGVRQSERFTIAKFKRTFKDEAIVQTEDPRGAMAFVTDESKLPGKSLVASGGWCAPSETLYDLVDISEAANLLSVPEMQINRGGVRHTLGPDYRTVFEDTGFCYTEEEDLAGDYDGAGGGSKPCATVPCPDFEDVRLGYCGVCIGAGLLQQRGYPEVIEDYINKTLNAHAHRVSAAVINSIAAASTLVNFASPQAGAAAPLLTAVDLQATHYRAVNRMDDKATLEIVLPTWVKAVLRSDLARRLGLAEFEVSDQRINSWFTNRNVNAQYVVDWQDISTVPAANFIAAPSGVEFLLYAGGTFVKGVSDSITFENIYDSVLLGTNDYTALFTEDPYLVLQRNHDARRVVVPVQADGATHMGIEIKADGTF
jgi:hypothetical protein